MQSWKDAEEMTQNEIFQRGKKWLGGNSPLQCVTLEKCTPRFPSIHIWSHLIILLSTKIFVIFRYRKESRLLIYFRKVKDHEMFRNNKDVWRHWSYDNCCVELSSCVSFINNFVAIFLLSEMRFKTTVATLLGWVKI